MRFGNENRGEEAHGKVMCKSGGGVESEEEEILDNDWGA